MFQVSSTAVQTQKTYSIVVASVFLEPIACGQNFKKIILFPLLYPSWGCFGEVSKSQTLFVFVQTSNFQRTYSSKLAGKSREKRTMRNLVRRNKSHYYTICFFGLQRRWCESLHGRQRHRAIRHFNRASQKDGEHWGAAARGLAKTKRRLLCRVGTRRSGGGARGLQHIRSPKRRRTMRSRSQRQLLQCK